jgi:hypothetical protein
VYNAAIRLRRISGVRFRRTQLAALAPSYMSSSLQKFWYLDLQQVSSSNCDVQTAAAAAAAAAAPPTAAAAAARS